MKSPTVPWLPIAGRAEAAVRLYCFPHAGAGASAYQPWQSLLSDQTAAVPIQLPGRETRHFEPPLTSVESLIGLLGHELAPRLEPPFALFGHSMGALIAFEFARSLRRAGASEPLGLFVSGHPAPQVRAGRAPVHQLPDYALAVKLKQLGGIPDVIADDPDLLAFFLPLVRADLALTETYAYRPEPELELPVFALGASRDPTTPYDQLLAWREQTRGEFRVELFAGGHFFLLEHVERVLALIERALASWRLT